VFPGGFGTLDELCELLTLMQTQKLARAVPIFLSGPEYWNEIINFEAPARHGMISPEDLALFRFVDTPEAALKAIQASLQASPVLAPCPNFAPSRHHPK
jgi:predicted Rossmann-fold nucleotide-binding protein